MASQPIDPTKNLGNDATATFEADPRFTEPTPGSEGSSDNIEEQRTALAARDTDDLEDADEDDVDEDEEFDDEDEEDEEDLDDDAEEDEYEDDDEDEDDEDEDDAEEVAAAPALRADGLLGYEDEADDVENGRSEAEGNAARRVQESKLKKDQGNLRGTGEEDDDAGDVAPGVTEDETADDLDTDRIAAKASFAAQVLTARQAAVLRSAR